MRTASHVTLALVLLGAASCTEAASPTSVSTTDPASLIRSAAKAPGGVTYVLAYGDDGQVAPMRLFDLMCRADAYDPSQGDVHLVLQGTDTLTLQSDGTARLGYAWQSLRDGSPDSRFTPKNGVMRGTWTVIQGQSNWVYYGASTIIRVDLAANATRPAHQTLFKIHDANTLSRSQGVGGGCYTASGALVSNSRSAGFFFTRR